MFDSRRPRRWRAITFGCAAAKSKESAILGRPQLCESALRDIEQKLEEAIADHSRTKQIPVRAGLALDLDLCCPRIEPHKKASIVCLSPSAAGSLQRQRASIDSKR